MDIYKIIGNAILLTIVWMVFSVSVHQYRHQRPPRANIVSTQTVEINGRSVDVPIPSEDDMINADTRLSFMTEESFNNRMNEFRRTKRRYGLIAVLSGIGLLFIGARLGEHWAYGFACLLLGPIAVAYTGYRRSKFT